ncbi:structural maintenance of chromosomes protein, partial [Entamoeba invadens IP1]|uniref:structural maintenance of chromosomes protein n=1 Tax=Entamoeba invadens IP1 TaxID=370355 RepID=UPI0002C3DF2F
YKTQLDADKQNEQLQLNYNVTGARMKVVNSQINEITKRRNLQKTQRKNERLVKEAISLEKKEFKKNKKMLQQKIQKSKNENNLVETENLKAELEDLEINHKIEMIDLAERLVVIRRENAAQNLKNAVVRESKMRKIVELMGEKKRQFELTKGRGDICQRVMRQLDKRIEYFTFMENKAKMRLEEAVKAIERHTFELEEMKKSGEMMTKKKIHILNVVEESDFHKLRVTNKLIEENENKNLNGKITVYEYQTQKNSLIKRRESVEKRKKYVEKKLRELGDAEVFEMKERETDVRLAVRKLRADNSLVEQQMAGLKGKIDYFNKRMSVEKEVAKKVEIMRKTKTFYSQFEILRQRSVEQKQLLAHKKAELDDVSLKLLRHEEVKVENSIVEGNATQTYEEKKKEIKQKREEIQEKLDRNKDKMEQLRVVLSALRVEQNFWKAKDAFRTYTKILRRIEDKISYLRTKIGLKENCLAAKERNGFGQSTIAEDLKEEIGYLREELENLVVVKKEVVKKAVLKGQRFVAVGQIMHKRAVDDKEELRIKRSRMIKKIFDIEDNNK